MDKLAKTWLLRIISERVDTSTLGGAAADIELDAGVKRVCG